MTATQTLDTKLRQLEKQKDDAFRELCKTIEVTPEITPEAERKHIELTLSYFDNTCLNRLYGKECNAYRFADVKRDMINLFNEIACTAADGKLVEIETQQKYEHLLYVCHRKCA
jgi:hypothetical protein